ncbi:hypothetical protein ACHAQA_006524 [Verticillium albo-atrum]
MPAIVNEVAHQLIPRQRFGDSGVGDDVRSTSKTISTGIIVAIVLGIVGFLVFCGVVFCCLHKSRAKKNSIRADVDKYRLPDTRSSISTYPGGIASPPWADKTNAPATDAYGNTYGYGYRNDNAYSGGFGHTMASAATGGAAHGSGHH